MCLIVFSVGQHAQFPLVMAANRDEFFRRPTVAMDWWHSDLADGPVLAGRDQQSGGTWLAVSKSARITAVTNVRMGPEQPGGRSRGELPLLAQKFDEPTMHTRLLKEQHDYSGFNLVSVDPSSGWYFSNRDAHPGRHIHRGIYGLSNHLLQTPWPKLLRLREGVSDLLSRSASSESEALHQALISHLQDNSPAPDYLLPDTGVGLETERFLSSPFITGEAYGTRATTIITLDANGEILVTEQTWEPNAQKSEQRQFRWQRTP